VLWTQSAAVDPVVGGMFTAVCVLIGTVAAALFQSRRQAQATAADTATKVIEQAMGGIRELADQRQAELERVAARNAYELAAVNERLDECRRNESELRDEVRAAHQRHRKELEKRSSS
jgi:biopolymer transport protein ExbB/TolQ